MPNDPGRPAVPVSPPRPAQAEPPARAVIQPPAAGSGSRPVRIRRSPAPQAPMAAPQRPAAASQRSAAVPQGSAAASRQPLSASRAPAAQRPDAAAEPAPRAARTAPTPPAVPHSAPEPAPQTAAPALPRPSADKPLPDVAPLVAEAPRKARAGQKPARAARPAAGKRKRRLPPVLALILAVVRNLLFIALTGVKVAALAVVPLFLFWYGYTVDRNGWFQGSQYEREIAQAMLAGQAISNFGQMEEREITKLYAQNLSQAPASIAIGSSRVLQLDRTLAGDESFFNAGMIGAEYPDVMDSYYLFDRVGLTPGTVVFGVDPWLFSAGPDANTFKRVDAQMYNEFLRYGLGHTDVEVTQATENMSFWLALTSPAFFHETMDYYIDNKENGLRPSVVQGDVMAQITDVKMADGSLLYSTDFRNRSQEEVNADAQAQFTNTLVNCEEFYELDAEHVALFEEFIGYMRQNGSEVVFFLAPFHPNAYNWILNFPQRYSGFFQVENWLRQYAAENGIPVYGSYDPEAAGCGEADFFDAWHVRGSGIAKYFPGLPAIEAARAAGTLPDPLAVSPRMPTATEDPVL